MAITNVDYTTFTEEDPSSHLTVSMHHLDFDAYMNEDCYLYKDYGIDYFSDFEHKVDVKASGLDYGDGGYIWMLSNDIDDGYGLLHDRKTFIGISFWYDALVLEEVHSSDAYLDFSSTISEDTLYYLTITKSGTLLTCKIYSDSGRTILLDTLSLTLHADHKFRYLFGCNTYNTHSPNVCTLNIQTLSIEIPSVACDNNPFASLGLDTGCKLLLHYDADNDGLINTDELNQSYADYESGIITYEEFDFVSDAYINGSINVICPGCWEAPPMPATISVTATSTLPLWIWDEDGIAKIPCTRNNPVKVGMPFGIAVSEKGEENRTTIVTPHVDTPESKTIHFNTKLSDPLTPLHLRGTYTGNVIVNGGAGTIHVNLTSFTPEHRTITFESMPLDAVVTIVD